MLSKMWSVTSALMLAVLIAWVWAYPKLFSGQEIHQVFSWSALLTGHAFMETYVRWGAGAVALAAVVLLLIGRTRLLGAYVAAGLSLFYGILHASPWVGAAIPTYDVLVAGLQTGLSAEQILNAQRPDDVPIIMTLLNGILAGVVIVAELGRRNEAKAPGRVPAVVLN